MLHTHLKQALRLNRGIGYSFLVYGGQILVVLSRQESIVWSDKARLGTFVGLSALFLLINEGSLRLLKRHPKLDELMAEKLSLLIPVIGCALVAISYLITGQIGVLLFATVVMLQAQLFGHNGFSRVMLALLTGIFLACLPLGYPVVLGFHATASLGLPMLLAFVPFACTLALYGNIVSSMVRNTSSRVSKLQSLAATDGLTGLINRRQFNHQLDTEIARARRYKKPLSLGLFDIDDFKKINDFYGHTTGDRILKELGALVTVNVREADIPARYGGEEFALILPETGQIDAYELLERLRAMIERTVFCLPDNPMTISVSVGVAQMDGDKPKAFELIEKADAALYEAKKLGKNRVVYGILPTPKISYQPMGLFPQQ